MKSLDAIALGLKEIPDKASTTHGYTEKYARHFEPLRAQPVKLLEIGVWNGYSLAMWSEYFPRASIVGADIDIQRCKVDPPRCRLWQMDQSSKESLVNMAKELGPWDIIIDDGSHNPCHQILSFETLWPYLNPGGLYSIEDLHVNYTAYAGMKPRTVDFIGIVLQGDLHGRGKTLLASIENSPLSDQAKLDGRETTVRAIHLYRYLAIIEKR